MGRIYVELFHGRDDPDEDMEGWGFQGPVLGPFEEVHVTYAHTLRLKRGNDNWLHLPMVDDMIEYRGKYYGDWGFYPGKVPDHLKQHQERMATTLNHLGPL